MSRAWLLAMLVMLPNVCSMLVVTLTPRDAVHRSAPPTIRSAVPLLCAPKLTKAERLLLLAEKAELEAEMLEAEARALRPPQEGDTDDVEDNAAAAERQDAEPAGEDAVMALKAPLRWLGAYPAISLSFPALTSPAQKARQLSGDASASGVTLDFVLDTAANTNTISAQVAGPTSQGGLELTQVGSVAGGVGAGGEFGGGATYMLGNVELADAPKEERFVFMSGLSATALPIGAPGAAGLLGVAFLNSFAGGVEFCWGGGPGGRGGGGGAEGEPPSVTLYGDATGTEAARAAAGLRGVPLTPLPGNSLPSVTLRVNGVEVPALVDTGSPITVLNAAAAAAAGVEHAALGASEGNPFSKLATGLKAAQAAARGDVLTVGGPNGPVQLVRAQQPPGGVSFSLGDGLELGQAACYVGDLPGLAALDGLGATAGPAVVLGTDVLAMRPRMWYTPTQLYV